MRLILFDCDGTLVDSQHVIVAAMSEAFVRHGLAPPARAHVLSIVGLSLVQAVAALLVQEPEAPVEAVAEAYKDAYRDLSADAATREPLFPGARVCLEALTRLDDVVLGIATGKSRRGLARILAHHELNGFFETLQTADDAPSKPAPAMVFNALSETGASATSTVVVGDTTFDVEMAAAAGASAVGVGWGYHPAAALKAAGARAIADDFGALPGLLADVLPPAATGSARWAR